MSHFVFEILPFVMCVSFDRKIELDGTFSKCLRHLDLSKTTLGQKGLAGLAEALKEVNLISLNLTQCGIKGLNPIAGYLKEQPPGKLVLSLNKIGTPDVELLCEVALKKVKFKSLDISYCVLFPESGELIAKCLRNEMCNLEDLVLDGNRFDVGATSKILESLEINNKLQKLSIGRLPIPSQALARFVSSNKCTCLYCCLFSCVTFSLFLSFSLSLSLSLFFPL